MSHKPVTIISKRVTIASETKYMQADLKNILKRSQILYPNVYIQATIANLAYVISKDYKGDTPVLVCVLKGAYPFFWDLTRALKIPHEVEFIRCHSYGKNIGPKTKECEIDFSFDPNTELEGRRILVIEDVVDTGDTIDFITDSLESALAKDVRVCALLVKEHRTRVKPDYTGINTNKDEWLFGYGLDLQGLWRQLPNIYTYTGLGL